MVFDIKPDHSVFSSSPTHAVNVLRRGIILTAIERRFGTAAKRIWNMLLLDGQLEQKAVADAAMVPNSEARMALYAMLKDG